jgi:hypothetical protein
MTIPNFNLTAVATGTIIDDLGYTWRFNGERIVVDGDDSEDGGYDCNSFEDGVRLLIEYEYITPKRRLP